MSGRTILITGERWSKTYLGQLWRHGRASRVFEILHMLATAGPVVVPRFAVPQGRCSTRPPTAGGSGYTGQLLVEAFLARGWDVASTHHTTAPLGVPGCREFQVRPLTHRSCLDAWGGWQGCNTGSLARPVRACAPPAPLPQVPAQPRCGGLCLPGKVCRWT
jgi:hypothetical protein